MKIFNGLDKLNIDTASVIVLGKFDGVHLGHQKLLSEAKNYAKQISALLIAIVVDTDNDHIMGKEKQEELLNEFGVDCLIRCRIEDIKDIKAEEFISDYLVDKLCMKAIVAGEDVRFGYKALGDAAMLDSMSHLGYEPIIIEKVCLLGDVISSTRIRTAIANGEETVAKKLLGR